MEITLFPAIATYFLADSGRYLIELHQKEEILHSKNLQISQLKQETNGSFQKLSIFQSRRITGPPLVMISVT